MALGAEVAEGTRKLTIRGRVVSGAIPDLVSVAFRPLFRPYSVNALLRVTVTGAGTFDLDMTWQALPRLDVGEVDGSVIGLGT